MKSLSTVFALLFMLLALSSCATLDKDECLTADWYAIGFEDSSLGRGIDYVANHRKACAEHGVTVAFQQYQQGHQAGTIEFCKPSRALRIASSGSSYPEMCAEEQFPEFASAFAQGEQVYVAQQAFYVAEQAVVDAERAIEQVEQQIVENEAMIIANETSQDARRQLLEDNKALQLDIEALAAELSVLTQVMNEKGNALAQLREQFGLNN